MVGALVVTVLSTVRSELKAIGKTSTPLGAAALALAARLDEGSDSGSALAAVAKELRTTMLELNRGAGTVADPVDELQKRRKARLKSG